MGNKFNVSVAPHIKDDDTVEKIMYAVLLALLPALAGSVYFFGLKALWLSIIGMISAVITEYICQKVRGVKVSIADGSALVTGLLVAFNVPPDTPWWIPAVGSAFGIVVGKEIFGGLGYNILNPALVGRAFLMASWPIEMTTKWIKPRGGTLSGIKAVTSATPLTTFKEMSGVVAEASKHSTQQVQNAHLALSQLSDSWLNVFLGNIGGVIGETSALLLLIGGLYLIARKIVDWRIPLSYIGTVALLSWIIMGPKGLFTGNVFFHVFSGGLMLGAFFMATDMVTSPITPKGRWIFGIGCGVLTVFIRKWGGYPEGVSYSILLMNVTVPLINKFTKPRVFGTSKQEEETEQK